MNQINLGVQLLVLGGCGTFLVMLVFFFLFKALAKVKDRS